MSPDYNEKQCKRIQDVKKEQTIASLQHELEELKKENGDLHETVARLTTQALSAQDSYDCACKTEAIYKEQLAASESALRKFKVAFESSELAAKLLKQDLAASEAGHVRLDCC